MGLAKSFTPTSLVGFVIALFMAAFLSMFVQSFAFAQIPTTAPTVVTDAISDAYLFIGDSGVLFLGVIATLALIKWIRGVLF